MARRSIPRQEYAMHEKRAARLRKILIARAASIPQQRVAVLLSSGVDSHAALFACLAAGKQVTCYNFCLNDRVSKDRAVARETCAEFGLKLIEVDLDPAVERLQDHVLDIFNKYGAGYHINKSSVECTWPVLETLKRVKEQVVVTGMGADVFFATTRSWKKKLATYDQDVVQPYYQTAVVKRREIQEMIVLRWLSMHKPHITEYFSMFHDANVFKAFAGMHPFDEGNKPIQKAPIRLAFWDEFERCKVLVHQSFNKGDSGISDAFESLVESDWNTKGFKSVVGLYNLVEVGAIARRKKLF